MKGVFERGEAVISLLGRFTVLRFLCPTMFTHNPHNSELTYTNSHSKDQKSIWSSSYSMTKPHALCAGMDTKIGDICLGIFKQ